MAVVTIPLPYGSTTLPLHIEEERLKAVVLPQKDGCTDGRSQEELVREALENPIDSPRLREIARGKKKITLVTSDHTRAVPSRITLPLLLKELRCGAPDAQITIFIATGLHRRTTQEEQRRMFGDEIVEHERIVVNDAFAQEDFSYVCVLPSGAELWVNKTVLDCDLLLCEGFIEPHFFAGFSGGRKSILPGSCNAVTVNENHSYRAIASPYAKAGVLEHNPIHEDMVYAARRVNVQFICNVALDEKKKVIAAFCGDLERAHEAGTAFVRRLSQVESVKGDIVVTSNGGLPLDQNLYQSPKAATTAEACCREGGVIILACSCSDGMGGTNFERLMTLGTPEEIDRYLSCIPAKESIAEQWCAQTYARILSRHRVILVSQGLDSALVCKANMIPASTPDEALAIARSIMGQQAEVVVIPDGVAVIAAGGKEKE